MSEEETVPDNCDDCREGREAFQHMIDMVEADKTVCNSPRHAADVKVVAELRLAMQADTNCGNPKCPNRAKCPRKTSCGPCLCGPQNRKPDHCHHKCPNTIEARKARKIEASNT